MQIFSLLFQNPFLALVWVMAILCALTLHEFSHALMAHWRGDSTAERANRLTLNPLAHIDLLGLIPLLFFGFGWAKPVPFNPYNFRHPKWDSVLVALAGPASNLLFASVAAILLRFLLIQSFFTPTNLLVVFLFLVVLINLFLMMFNLIPIHPLDGSKLLDALLDAPRYQALRMKIATYGPQILLLLVFLSLLTPFNIFFFISEPSFSFCNFLVGDRCDLFYFFIFSS